MSQEGDNEPALEEVQGAGPSAASEQPGVAAEESATGSGRGRGHRHTVIEIRSAKVAKSTQNSYLRNAILFLRFLRSEYPEVISDEFLSKFPQDREDKRNRREYQKEMKAHLENAPRSAPPLRFEEVTAEQVLGKSVATSCSSFSDHFR
ncbi:unnamed protein product [Phaeothamnion confervicola]